MSGCHPTTDTLVCDRCENIYSVYKILSNKSRCLTCNGIFPYPVLVKYSEEYKFKKLEERMDALESKGGLDDYVKQLVQTKIYDISKHLSERIEKLEKLSIDGCHEGIKRAIREIEKIEDMNKCFNEETSLDLQRLKNELGILVYINWPSKI